MIELHNHGLVTGPDGSVMNMDPGIDGLDIYKKVLELHPGQKAIIASRLSETDRVKRFRVWVRECILKSPFCWKRSGLLSRKSWRNRQF